MKKITVIFQSEARARMRNERNSHCILWCKVLDIAHYTVRNVRFPANQSWPPDLESLRIIHGDFNGLFQECITICQVIEVQITSGFENGVGIEFQVFAKGHELIFSFRLHVSVTGEILFLGCTSYGQRHRLHGTLTKDNSKRPRPHKARFYFAYLIITTSSPAILFLKDLVLFLKYF